MQLVLLQGRSKITAMYIVLSALSKPVGSKLNQPPPLIQWPPLSSQNNVLWWPWQASLLLQSTNLLFQNIFRRLTIARNVVHLKAIRVIMLCNSPDICCSITAITALKLTQSSTFLQWRQQWEHCELFPFHEMLDY